MGPQETVFVTKDDPSCPFEEGPTYLCIISCEPGTMPATSGVEASKD